MINSLLYSMINNKPFCCIPFEHTGRGLGKDSPYQCDLESKGKG